MCQAWVTKYGPKVDECRVYDMGHAWVTEDVPKVDECRITERVMPGLLSIVPGSVYAE